MAYDELIRMGVSWEPILTCSDLKQVGYLYTKQDYQGNQK